MKKQFITFTNEGAALEMVTMINELAIGADGWAQIAPYGDYPGVAMIPNGKGAFTKERAIQRLDKIAVTEMANEYKQSSRGLSGFFRKRPLFEGHPDIPIGGSQYPNKNPVGLFHNIAAREDGLYGEPIMTDAGEKLVADKTYRALSGRWAAEFVARENDVNIYRPVKFLSAGLTNQPNLPVQLLNEAEPTNHNPNKTMLKKLIPWFLTHGITVANDATEEQVESALNQLTPKITSAVTLANEKTALEGKVVSIEGLKTKAETDLANTKTQFANERKARIESELGRALKDGRITAAEKPTWETRLANEAQFANELTALDALKPVLKTASELNLGQRRIDISTPLARKAAQRTVMAEIANELHLDAVKDYETVYREMSTRHPALVGGNHPKVKKF